VRKNEPRFGTDGVRGVANQELTPFLAFRIGLAAAFVLGERSPDRKVIVGRDTRLSGHMLEAALTAGLTSMGHDVARVGVAPTPSVSQMVQQTNAAAGVVISASHNPFQDNGIKFFGPDGKKLSDDIERGIESAMDRWQALPVSPPESIGRVYESASLLEGYIQQVKATCRASLAGLKLVLDCANGATYAIAPDLFRDLGAEVIVIHAQPDGVNINENCGSTRPAEMCARVRETGADAGLAFDGDGDRVMMCDERGDVVDGDRMLAICALGMKERAELTGDLVVATIMSNAGLEVALERAGIRMTRADVGDRYVAEEMRRTGASLGGEQSGHLLFPRIALTGDGMVTGLQVLSEVCLRREPLSAMASVVQTCPQILRNVRVRDRHSWRGSPEIVAAIEAARRRVGKPEWLSVRASGTEPLIRVMAQDPDGDLVEQVVSELCGLIAERYGVPA
jgi:phosphoglucosamine mutase